MGISQYRLARDISVPPRRVNEIVLKKRGVTADTALRLGRYFGTSEQFWLNLQGEYDLDVERDRLGERLVAEVAQFGSRDRDIRVSEPEAPPVRRRISATAR
jgi:addiction module HigA family antidote